MYYANLLGGNDLRVFEISIRNPAGFLCLFFAFYQSSNKVTGVAGKYSTISLTKQIHNLFVSLLLLFVCFVLFFFWRNFVKLFKRLSISFIDKMLKKKTFFFLFFAIFFTPELTGSFSLKSEKLEVPLNSLGLL